MALLTDLSKAFACLDHDLMIAKLEEYGFGYKALKLIHSYLSGRKQRIRITSTYSSWTEAIYGVPQGSILGPLIFNIYLADLFPSYNDFDIANFAADDNSPFVCCNDIESVVIKLQKDTEALLT